VAASAAWGQPPKGSWAINANGFAGELVVESVIDCKVDGTLLGDRMRGFYDEKTACLSVLRLRKDGTTYQSYKGYLFRDVGQKEARYHLAGVFQVYGGEGNRGVEYGWYARLNEPQQ